MLIENVAVSDDFVDISLELSWSCVLICPQMIFYRLQIHGFLNNLVVVGYSEGNWVDWFSEGP